MCLMVFLFGIANVFSVSCLNSVLQFCFLLVRVELHRHPEAGFVGTFLHILLRCQVIL